jgi:hypothetical protein
VQDVQIVSHVLLELGLQGVVEPDVLRSIGKCNKGQSVMQTPSCPLLSSNHQPSIG